MELVNNTPIPAEVVVSDVQLPYRIGSIIAKATFRFGNGSF